MRELAAMVADEEAPPLGVAYERIQVRDQRTRWGSCSSRGTLSFNWRLALAPHGVLDYVVVHELCHLREPNHSRALLEPRRERAAPAGASSVPGCASTAPSCSRSGRQP